MLSAACTLTPTCCTPVGPQSQSTCWCPSPLEPQRERERAKSTLRGLGVNIPKSLTTHAVHAQQALLKIICRHVDAQIHPQKNVRTFLVCIRWTNQCCRGLCGNRARSPRPSREVRKHEPRNSKDGSALKLFSTLTLIQL